MLCEDEDVSIPPHGMNGPKCQLGRVSGVVDGLLPLMCIDLTAAGTLVYRWMFMDC